MSKAFKKKSESLKLSELKPISAGVGLGDVQIKSFQEAARSIKRTTVPTSAPQPQNIKRTDAVRAATSWGSESLKKMFAVLFRKARLFLIDLLAIGTMLTLASASVLIVVTIQGGDQALVKSWVMEQFLQIHPLWLVGLGCTIYGVYRGIFTFFFGSSISHWVSRPRSRTNF